MSRTRVDANLIWALYHANQSFPRAQWLFVVDADSFVFPVTVRASATPRATPPLTPPHPNPTHIDAP